MGYLLIGFLDPIPSYMDLEVYCIKLAKLLLFVLKY